MFTFWKAYVKYVNEQLTKEVSYKNLEMKFSALKLWNKAICKTDQVLMSTV